MTFVDWLRETGSRVRDEGRAGARESAYELELGLWRRLSGVYSYDPVYLYDEPWDILVVLDACRYDLMGEVAAEYEFLSGLGVVDSAAACTPEWMKANFTDVYREGMAETVHVTANMWSETHLSPDDFAELEEVWTWGWDDELKTVRPETVTDAAIYHHRRRRPERMLVHYIQPHYPFIPDPLSYGDRRGDGEWVKVWDRLRRGEVSRERVWNAYRDNLRLALGSVETLLRNVDADSVVITSDHGNLVGEYGLYGHPDGVALPPSRRVPWAETGAENVDEREIELEREDSGGDGSVDRDEKLAYLGYR